MADVRTRTTDLPAPRHAVIRREDYRPPDWLVPAIALDFVLDPANRRQMTAEYRGRTRHYYQIDWNGRHIWGATAAMLVNLTKRIS